MRLTSDCFADWADTVALGRPIRIEAAAMIVEAKRLFAGCMGVTFGVRVMLLVAAFRYRASRETRERF